MNYAEVFYDENSLMIGNDNGVMVMAPSASPSNPTDPATVKSQSFYFRAMAIGPGMVFLCSIEGAKADFDTWYSGITPGPTTTVEVPNDNDPKYYEWRSTTIGTGLETGGNTPTDRWNIGVGLMKNDVVKSIDDKTKDLIFSGFEYPAASGQIFSLSIMAQQKWTNMFLGKDILTYPIRVTTADENTDVNLADAAAVTAFYTEFIQKARALIDEGRDLKIAVQAASDFDGVAAKKNENAGRA